MSQSAVLKYCYETVFEQLKTFGTKSRLFSIESGSFHQNIQNIQDIKNIEKVPDEKKKKAKSTVYMNVSDISQTALDKNGQTIVIDDIMYEAPAMVGFLFSFMVTADHYPELLETAGALVRYFKDTNSISAGDYTWHGNGDTIYIEPVIREPDSRRTVLPAGMPALVLEYRLEAGINTEKGHAIKRVEKVELKSRQTGK
jgi:hypothetical protein